jgi:4,5-DOPA dioxygenase extradiol
MAFDRQPICFTAHGNPMNALGRTAFARFLIRWGADLPRPRALLVVSAHWEQARLQVTAAERPETIHGFYGFPQELYGLSYPAPGDPALAKRVQARLRGAGMEASLDPTRGLDHGAWAPLRGLVPAADLPVVQLSLLAGVPFPRHLEVGRALAPLRDEGVLILGSGNLVHNLATADLGQADLPPVAWAVAFDDWVRHGLDTWDLAALAEFAERAPYGGQAHPTAEHYLPLLVACGAADPRPRVSYPYEGFEHGSLSLRCVRMD